MARPSKGRLKPGGKPAPAPAPAVHPAPRGRVPQTRDLRRDDQPAAAAGGPFPLDSSGEFDRALEDLCAGKGEAFVLKLYVAGSARRSAQAISAIRAVCEQHLQGRYDLEVIDIYQQPESATDAQIVAAPTLVRESPKPRRRMVGSLTNRARVLAGLDVPAQKGGALP